MTSACDDDDFEFWRQVIDRANAVLPEIDAVFNEQNVPIRARVGDAAKCFLEACLEIKGGTWHDTMETEAYARILALINDWYRTRYGAAFENESDDFPAAVEIFGSAFLLNVPSKFSIPGEKKGTVWIGWPASVQKEENPLDWIEGGPNLGALHATAHTQLREQIHTTANAVRSINYDLRAISYDTDQFGQDLTASVGADLKGAALDLCARDDARLRNAGWEISQAVEKALKLAIHRSGSVPQKTHSLAELVGHLEQLCSIEIDRNALKTIPSGRAATDLRYGGSFPIGQALTAYRSALRVIRPTLLSVEAKSKYNTRALRLLLKTPPWFTFDTDSFLKKMKITPPKNP